MLGVCMILLWFDVPGRSYRMMLKLGFVALSRALTALEAAFVLVFLLSILLLPLPHPPSPSLHYFFFLSFQT